MEIISFIAHGHPGPDLERCAVLGPPRVGALKAPEAFEKASSKDRAKGWVRAGYGACAAESVTFAQCMFGADVQK
jgi:hypothetical protein